MNNDDWTRVLTKSYWRVCKICRTAAVPCSINWHYPFWLDGEHVCRACLTPEMVLENFLQKFPAVDPSKRFYKKSELLSPTDDLAIYIS